MCCCWLVMWLLFSPWLILLKLLIVHSFLRMKRAPHPSFSTTTTCGTKTCKCPFSWSYDSVPVMDMCLSHTKQDDAGSAFVVMQCAAFTVLLVAADPKFAEGLHVAHCDSCPLLGISIQSVEYSMDTQSDSVAPSSLSLSAGEIMKCWRRPHVLPSEAHLCCLLIQHGSTCAALFKVTLKSRLLWKWKRYY